MDATEALCRHAAGLSVERISAAAVAATKVFLLDTLGVALAGWRHPFTPVLIECAQGWGQGGACRLIGGDARGWPAPTAAMINAWLIHNQEFDCVHEPAVVHPMAVILAALLAEVDRRGGARGAELLLALVIAVDIAASLGSACRTRLRFFRPAQCGALGALAAVLRLRGADAGQIRSGFGLLLGQLSGTMQAHREGVAALPMQIAYNARNVLVAADLASAGLAAPQHAIEGEFGYYALFEGAHELAREVSDLGQRFRIAEVSHKPFPSGRATHGGLDGLLSLQAQHGFGAAEVAAVRLQAPPLVRQLVDRPVRPAMRANEAKLCFPFVAAVALQRGGVDVADFDAAALVDAETLALAARVAVLADANPDVNALAPVQVEVQLHDGRVYAQAVPQILGAPARPLSQAAHLAKFRRNLAGHPGAAQADTLIEAVEALPALADVRILLDLLSDKSSSLDPAEPRR